MLTGDQIYSDDLATALLPWLNSLGAALLGLPPETVPVDGVDDAVPVTLQSFPAGRRLKLIRATAGMTSDDGDDHLIGFGEFASMYLLSLDRPAEGQARRPVGRRSGRTGTAKSSPSSGIPINE